jgi:hypothetical protein
VRHPDAIAATLMGVPWGTLDERTRKVARHVAEIVTGRTVLAQYRAAQRAVTRP